MTTEVQHDLSHAKREAAWLEFDAENPHVFEKFTEYALDAIRAGRRKMGAHCLTERLRWFYAVEIKSVDGFRLNDHHAPFMARRFLREHPEHAGFFETRDQAPRKSRRATA